MSFGTGELGRQASLLTIQDRPTMREGVCRELRRRGVPIARGGGVLPRVGTGDRGRRQLVTSTGNRRRGRGNAGERRSVARATCSCVLLCVWVRAVSGARSARKPVLRNRDAACHACGLLFSFEGWPRRYPWTVRDEPRRTGAARFQRRMARGGAPAHGRHAARRYDFSRPPRLSSQWTLPMGPLTTSGANSPVRTALGTRLAMP